MSQDVNKENTMKLNKLKTEKKKPRGLWEYAKKDCRTIYRTKKKWFLIAILSVAFYLFTLNIILLDWEYFSLSKFLSILILTLFPILCCFLLLEDLKHYRERSVEYKKTSKS